MTGLLEPFGSVASPLFSSIVRASLQGAVFVLLVWAVCRLLPRIPASVKCTLWWLATLKMLVALAWIEPPALRVLPPAATASIGAPVKNSPIASLPVDPPGPAVVRQEEPGNLRTRSFAWASAAVGLWAAILTLLSAALVYRICKLLKIASRAVDATPEVRMLAADLSALLGLSRIPGVRISEEIDTPLVIGFFHPMVLIPAGRFNALSIAGRRMALCHELIHLRRQDPWLAFVPALAERFFFFHPLVPLAVREYELAREAACDAAVLRKLDAQPADYGRLLLALGVARMPRNFAAAGAPHSYSTLKRRITMLGNPSKIGKGLRTAASTATVLAACAIVPVQFVARPVQQVMAAQTPAISVAQSRPAEPVVVAAQTPVISVSQSRTAKPVMAVAAPTRSISVTQPRPAKPVAAAQTPVISVSQSHPDEPVVLAAPTRSISATQSRPAKPAVAAQTPAVAVSQSHPDESVVLAAPTRSISVTQPRPAKPVAAAQAPAVAVSVTQPRPAAPTVRAVPQRTQDLTYVFFIGDRNRMMSGSDEDVARAEKVRRPGERLLWFRRDGREYVVRDPALLTEVEQIFRPLQEIGKKQGEIGARQGDIGTRQGRIGSEQGKIGAMQGEIGARQGQIGALQAEIAAQEAALAASRRDKNAIAAQAQELEKRRRELDSQMQLMSTQMQQLSAQMRSFTEPMNELGKQMGVLSREMEVLSSHMKETSAKVEADLRRLLERAVATGAATEVR